MLEFLRVLSGVFIPFVEGIRIIGFLLGVISLTTSSVSVQNLRFYEERDNIVFSFYLENAFNEKFQKLITSEIPSHLVFDIAFSVKGFYTNYVFTNSVFYSSYNREFRVSFYFMDRYLYYVSKNFDDVMYRMCSVFVRIPKDMKGKDVNVRIVVKPICEYEGFNEGDVSKIIWGGVFSISLNYRL